MVAGACVAALQPVAAVDGAIITNGTIQLGVNPTANLIVGGGTPSAGSKTTFVGLRYVPNNTDAAAPGCHCEGWGAADELTGVTGYVNEDIDLGVNNMISESFTRDSKSAVSVVRIGTTLRVTHDFKPLASTPNLYSVVVTILNTSAKDVIPRYRRVLDWDIEPTQFSEYVGSNVGDAQHLIYANSDGFATANPLGPRTCDCIDPPPLHEGNFTDAGPNDYGALFDFRFPRIAPGEWVTFDIFYGGARSQAEALGALGAARAEAFSIGKPGTSSGAQNGVPNTYVLGFARISGNPIFCEHGLSALRGSPAEGAPSGLIHDHVEPAAEQLVKGTGQVVHSANCQVVDMIERRVNEKMPVQPDQVITPNLPALVSS